MASTPKDACRYRPVSSHIPLPPSHVSYWYYSIPFHHGQVQLKKNPNFSPQTAFIQQKASNKIIYPIPYPIFINIPHYHGNSGTMDNLKIICLYCFQALEYKNFPLQSNLIKFFIYIKVIIYFIFQSIAISQNLLPFYSLTSLFLYISIQTIKALL